MEEQIPEILYHYCSVDTFVKIVQNKTLRLSEIAKSNDSMECQWLERVVIPDLIKKCLKERLRSSNIDSARHEKIIEEAISFINEFYNSDRDIIQQRMVLATCFSKEDDFLSQWRGYANDGQGVAIGFNADIFKNIRKSYENTPLKLEKVLYEQKDQEQVVIKEVSRYIETFADDSQYKKRNIAMLALLIRSTISSVFIKNKAFIEEAEWRLVANLSRVKDSESLQSYLDNLMKYDLITSINVHARQDGFMYYGDLKYENLKQAKSGTSIRTIVLGRKCKIRERIGNCVNLCCQIK